MLLAFAVDALLVNGVVAIFAALISALGVILAARYGFLTKRGDSVDARVERVERREAICQDKLAKLREVAGLMVYSLDIYGEACPDAASRVQATTERLRRRLAEFDVLDATPDDPHVTESGTSLPKMS